MNGPRTHAIRSRSRLLTALAAASIVTLLHLFSATWRADAWMYDALVQASSHTADDRIVIVAIDEKSLTELGRWPWSRRTHAELLGRLGDAGVRGVALNILLSEPALFDPEGDALLAQALNRSGKVVLPVYAEAEHLNGPSVELMPIPEFAAAAASLGHVDMALDGDGMARSMFLRAGLGSPHWPSLALALSQIGNEPNPAAELPGLRVADLQDASPHRWVRDYQVLIPYTDPPDGFQTVSYVDVLKGTVPPSLLRGRWVLVGVTAAGMGDELAAPGWHATEPRMSGIDYQANALNMLMGNDAVVPLSITWQVALSSLMVILPLLLLGLPGLHRIWRPMLIALLTVPLLSWLLLRFAHVWYPPVPALLVLGLGASLLILRALRRTRLQAQSDPLTGLANRIKFDEELEQELRSARRTGQPLSLLLLDVDHFKRLNDGLGHPAGDEVLRALSTILRGRARRPRDLVARLGGDEFAVLLPETTPQAAAAIATTIHVDLANLSSRTGNHVPLPPFTASIGIHTTQSEEETAAYVFELADNALYQAKQAGRNRSFSHTGERGCAPS
ncbi:CHASE2 domain-containing protein [Pseudoxanthomonas sacheonensis]|uniref:CHASE2 domain-containing protein n=1 Tax=Pseudoxanthomonas sacheonensis TaxID=443615 RepID=UPI0013D33925|nr:CHASE2 domain-containing protein [Pseudoxanthomonas sacheonensis]